MLGAQYLPIPPSTPLGVRFWGIFCSGRVTASVNTQKMIVVGWSSASLVTTRILEPLPDGPSWVARGRFALRAEDVHLLGNLQHEGPKVIPTRKHTKPNLNQEVPEIQSRKYRNIVHRISGLPGIRYADGPYISIPNRERPVAADTAKAGLKERGSGPRGSFKPIRLADFSL